MRAPLRTRTASVVAALAVAAAAGSVAAPGPSVAAAADASVQVTGRSVPGRGVDATVEGTPAGAAPRQQRRAVAAAGGNPKSVGYLTSPPTRWNPCKTITYRVNLAGAPKGALADVDRAVRQVALASGLAFRRVGTTKVVPGSRGRGVVDAYPAGTDLVIAYTRPGRTGYLPKGSSNVLAVGGVFFEQRVRRVKGHNWHKSMRGYLVVDATKRLPGGFGPGNRTGYLGTWGQVLMHEMGHVVGLGHPKVKDPAQIMYPQTTYKKAVWGAGDLVGLRALGRRSGCF